MRREEGPLTKVEEGVSLDTFYMIVRRLANQAPTRYWMQDVPQVGMIAIEVWFTPKEEWQRLNKELNALGFTLDRSRAVGDYVARRWIAKRKEEMKN